MSEKFHSHIENYYTDTFSKFGDTPKGVDWNDLTTQNLRFEMLIKDLDLKSKCSILDLGCGTGDLLKYINSSKQEADIHYIGLDFVEGMIETAKQKYAGTNNAEFIRGSLEDFKNSQVDYVVASGIFNVRQGADEAEWEQYILSTITEMFSKASKAIAFNILTSYVDWTIDKLYYADPKTLLNYSVKNLSRKAIINHSYPLYEYTMTIFK